MLLVSAVIALMGLELGHFYGALIFLGIGWNFGFIGGTHMLQAALAPHQRPLVQGINDTILAISSSAASLLSGMLFVTISWIGLATLAGPLLLAAALVLFAISKVTRKRAAN